MNLTKQMIQKSFPIAMRMLYEFSIADGSFRNTQTHNSPVEIEDITSRFTKQEFEDLARPYFESMAKIPVKEWGDLPQVRIAYSFVMMRYESQERVTA